MLMFGALARHNINTLLPPTHTQRSTPPVPERQTGVAVVGHGAALCRHRDTNVHVPAAHTKHARTHTHADGKAPRRVRTRARAVSRGRGSHKDALNDAAVRMTCGKLVVAGKRES